MKDRYCIVRAGTVSHLEDLVNQAMAEGWNTAGGPFHEDERCLPSVTLPGQWCQALTRNSMAVHDSLAIPSASEPERPEPQEPNVGGTL
jgi:hypothetical protein